MSCLVVIPIIVIYDLPITVHLIWIPIGVFLAAVLALGIGMMFAPLNCAQRDVQHFVEVRNPGGILCLTRHVDSGNGHGSEEHGEAALWNPMVLPITMVRHGVEGKIVNLPPEIIASSLIATLVFYLLGTIIFSKYERQAVKYL